MLWLIRILLFVPSLVAGWIVARADPRFWVVTMAIALIFLALAIIAGIYVPGLHPWARKRR